MTNNIEIPKFNPRTVGTTSLSSDDQLLLNELEKQNRIEVQDSNVIEFLKCRQNIFYFLHNYVYIEEVGGKTLYTPDKTNPKVRRLIKSIHKHHKAMLMASRQLGKSTLAAIMIAHALTFYPGTKAIIINMDMSAGTESISKVRFILENLPAWMRFVPPRSVQHKTKIELINDSSVNVVYPSTIKTP